MIIFTVTNTLTHQIYVGSTRNDLEDQWEKMVAAAEQDLDYPLYRDIRRYGTEIFHREVYDMAENRSELAELEQNAVDELDAISLRGHKTSTVIIKKKVPVRRKASDAEKELLDLLDSFAADELIDELPIEEDSQKKEQTSTSDSAIKDGITGTSNHHHIQTKIPDHPLMTMSIPERVCKTTTDRASKFDALAAAKAIIAQAVKEEEEKAAAAKAEAEAAAERSKRASRTNGNISIDLNLDDSINAQLAAITAAIDGVLAGDTSAASGLETHLRQPSAPTECVINVQAGGSASVTQAEPVLEMESVPEQRVAVVEESIIEEPEAEPVRKISEKEQRIINAIAHHRAARAQRSSAVIEAEIASLKAQLETFNEYIMAMTTSHA